ncbi:hypothetical protein [Streptomyces ipomoeae]|uniref:hypothetical protein n=1 Tax=Streptomyces ipomoeae TaxID=103232 RepID=UPI0018F88C60|nr:hypothetical protein [Streptomyces ipomoeae]MDX2698561.1 hypothetical protein [Streptomyces ipomoeae]MDX2842033.1 hypothetical protein [Streptomyces ipomoeae]
MSRDSTWSWCRHIRAASAPKGSDSRKLWMCCSTGLTSRSLWTAVRTSHSAVASCAAAPANRTDSSRGLIS